MGEKGRDGVEILSWILKLFVNPTKLSKSEKTAFLSETSFSWRDVLYSMETEGDPGVMSRRLTHLLNMLNSDHVTVKELARVSLLLDLRRRKVPLARDTEDNFLGFRRKANGKLDTRAAGFGVWSDWPDLNDLCNWTGVELSRLFWNLKYVGYFAWSALTTVSSCGEKLDSGLFPRAPVGFGRSAT
ncbi:hypothetical protein J4Q44_G00351310 [Coregonus suidteri]|uniref:Uncharacterized protein n=1 Tax=Coregonus suidteri TaxID=861788 RepID=A0AAN8KSN9_9TELE